MLAPSTPHFDWKTPLPDPNLLSAFGINEVFHYTPMHYLPLILRESRLRSKSSLRQSGFEQSHFRSKSRNQDENRGFGNYVHLSTETSPEILQAKLRAGFPHVEIRIPSLSVERVNYHLCRFNVAMTRYLKRDGKLGSTESPANGVYHGDQQIPTAQTTQEKHDLLRLRPAGKMIEVLVLRELLLNQQNTVVCFSEEDQTQVKMISEHTNSLLKVELRDPDSVYNRKSECVRLVEEFIELALRDPDWRGNGLEFDQFR